MGYLWNRYQIFLAFASMVSISGIAEASSTVNWTKPNGRLPSFTDNYTTGERIILSWLSLNESHNDLWVTRIDTSTDDFALRLAVSLDISAAGSFEWTIGISNEEIKRDTRFMLRFLKSGEAYEGNYDTDLASPGFNLLLVNQQTLPNGTAGSIVHSASTVVSTAVATTAIRSGTEAGQTSINVAAKVSNTGLTSAGIAGAVVGAIIIIFSAVLLAFILFKRQERKNVTIKIENDVEVDSPYEVLGDHVHPAEMSAKEKAIHEIFSPWEARKPEVHEADTTIKRPGLHELPT